MTPFFRHFISKLINGEDILWYYFNKHDAASIEEAVLIIQLVSQGNEEAIKKIRDIGYDWNHIEYDVCVCGGDVYISKREKSFVLQKIVEGLYSNLFLNMSDHMKNIDGIEGIEGGIEGAE